MRALVTGSAGFLGRHFVTELQYRGFTVDLCDPAHARKGMHDAIDCRKLFTASPVRAYDLVVHCAALVDGREAIENKAALLGAYNLQLDGALFEWALRAKPRRLVYFSSSASYPTSLQRHGLAFPLVETHTAKFPAAPDASYGWTKLTGELIAGEVRNAGVPVTVVRPFSGYGEDQADCYPFPAIIARAKRRDDPFVVWGDGQQVRDFIHVDDIVAGTLALVEQQADGPVNLGTGRATSMDDLARLAMCAAGHDAPINHLSDKPSGVQHRVADTTLMRCYYTPTITLEQGIQRALAA